MNNNFKDHLYQNNNNNNVINVYELNRRYDHNEKSRYDMNEFNPFERNIIKGKWNKHLI